MKKTHALVQLLGRVQTVGRDKGLVESTLAKKVYLLRLVLEFIDELTVKELQRFFKEGKTHKGKPYNPHTRNGVRIELKWLFRHVFHQELPRELEGVLQKEHAPARGKKISEEDFNNLLSYAPSRLLAVAYQLIYDSGMRPHELLSLTSEAVSFPSPEVALIQLPDNNPKTPSGRNKTGGRPILVQGVSVEGLRQLVQQHQDSGRQSDLLFPFAHRSLSSIFCRMKQAYHQALQSQQSDNHPQGELPASSELEPTMGRLYDLRHTAATRLAATGLPDSLLRRTMGWNQASRMPNVYIHLEVSDLLRWHLNQVSESSMSTECAPNWLNSQESDISGPSNAKTLLDQIFKQGTTHRSINS